MNKNAAINLGKSILGTFVLLFGTYSSEAQVTIDQNTYTKPQLITDVLFGPGCVVPTDIQFTGANNQFGYLTDATSSIGFGSGVIISTGRVADADGNPTTGFASHGYSGGTGNAGDADLNNLLGTNNTFDAAFVTFKFIAQSTTMSFNYVFASEEYPEFVCSDFNDVFGLFISGPGIAGLQNMAVLPGAAGVVAINNVNNGYADGFGGTPYCATGLNGNPVNPAYYVGNNTDETGGTISANDFVFDGYTVVLTATQSGLTPCQEYTIKIAIADVMDAVYDSAIILEAGSFSAGTGISIASSTPTSNNDSIPEGCSSDFHFNLDVASGAPTVINYTVGGTATSGTDYGALSGSLTIPAGDTTGAVTINSILDGIGEGNETVTITTPTGCLCDPPATLTVDIFDIDSVDVVLNDTVICSGSSVTLTPSVTGGYGNYQYSWTGGATTLSNTYSPITTTTYTFTVIDDCGATYSENVTVNVNQPPSITNPGPQTVCSSYTLPAIAGTDLTGNEAYYTAPGGTTGQMNAGGTVTTAGANTIYIYDSIAAGCTDEESFVVTVNMPVNAGADNVSTLCNSAGSTLDISTLLDAAADAGGTWSETTASGQFTVGTTAFDASGLTPGDYTFIYVVPGVAPCVDDTAQFTITVSGIITAGADNTGTMCNGTGNVFDVSTLLDIAAAAGGTWAESTVPASGQFTGTNFDVAGVTPGAYTFTYDVAGVGTCPGDQAIFTITVTPAPVIDPISDITECTSALIPNITGTDLTANVGIFDTTNGGGTAYNVGDAYTTVGTTTFYAYDQTGTNPNCTVEQTFTITINTLPNAGVDNTGTLCNSAGSTLDLNTLVDPAAGAGMWIEVGASTGQFTTGTGVLDANGVAANVYQFGYIVTGTAPCPNDTAFFNITINATPQIDPVADASSCDSVQVPNFTGTNLTANVGIFDAVNGGGNAYNVGDYISTTGSTTLYVYDQTGTVPNCTHEVSYNVVVTLSPIAGADNAATVCNVAGTTLDLSTLLDVTAQAGGAWSEVTGSGQFNAGTSTLDAGGLATGQYQFLYVVVGTAPCVNDTATFNVTVSGIINAGADNNGEVCSGAGTYDVTSLIDPGADAGGTWQETTGTPSGQFDAATGTLTTTGLSGNYTFAYVLAGSGSCPGDQADFTVNVIASPEITPVSDTVVCDNMVLQNINGTNLTANVAYFDQAGGAGNQLNVGDAITTSSTVYMYDATGAPANCVAEQSFQITVNLTPVIDPIAAITNCDFVVLPAITGTNLTPNLSYYSEMGGAGTVYSAGDTIYSVGVTNIYAYDSTTSVPACTDEELFVSTIVTTPVANAGNDTLICNSLSYTLGATSSVGTGTWTGAGVTFDNANNPGATVTTVTPGTYTLVWTEDNGNGCVDSDTVVVSLSNLSYTDQIVQSNCGQNDGSITITASNGMDPLTYSIDSNVSTQNNGQFDNLFANAYDVFVVDNFGCVVSSIVTVTDLNGPSLDGVNTTDVSCYNVCDGSISVNATGASNYSIGSGFQPGNSFANVCPGTYTVIVENNVGCQDSTTVVINNAVELSVSLTSTDPTCFGYCDGIVEASSIGGTGTYQFSIDNGATWQADSVFNSVCAGASNVIVQDLAGCSDTASVTLVEPDSMSLVIGVQDVTCAGMCDGMINCIPSGGAGGYVYNWSNSGQNVPINIDLCIGTYDLVVTDANNCVIDSLGIVVSGPAPVAIDSVITNDENCFGDCNGSLEVIAPAASAFSLTPQGPFQSSNIFNGLCSGNYTVYAQDSAQCEATQLAVIGGQPPIELTTSNDTIICIGGTADLTANATGGVGGYTYDWDTGDQSQSISVSPGTASVYCVTATDANNCQSTQECVIVGLNSPIDLQAFSNQTICEGDQANILALATGGDGGPYTFTWDQNVGVGDAHVVSPTTTTDYTVTVTDGCETPSASQTITITVATIPNISFTADTVEGCAPVAVNFSSVNVPNGSTCLWSFGDGGVSQDCGTTPYTFGVEGCWDVSLTITTAENCVATFSQNDYVCVYGYPEADFSYSPEETTIMNTSIDFNNLSTGATSYLWSFDTNGANEQDPGTNPTYVFPADQPGTYEVCLTAVTENGCPDDTCQTVEIKDEFIIYVPNAFTPGGGDQNDIFLPVVKGHDPLDYEFIVFDRWGLVVFQTQIDSKGWDGTYKGKDAPTDVYVWKVLVADQIQGRKREYIGHVTLLR